MKKNFYLIAIFVLLFSTRSSSQLNIDLGNFTNTTETIDLNTKPRLIIKNLVPNPLVKYSFIIEMIEVNPPFDKGSLSGSKCKQDEITMAFKEAYKNLNTTLNEDQVEDLKQKLSDEMDKLNGATYGECIQEGLKLLKKTTYEQDLLFKLKNNETITITIKKTYKTDGKDVTTSFIKIFKTPEKTRWLIHYGLTYAPNIISKVDHYFSQADTSATNKYTITKENDNGPKAWENISATINFTYPFHSDSRDFDWGFTAGFGLNPGFELSGHTGLSAIIGENVIIGTGIAFMQKYKLMGAYKENQVIKTNLNFEALHHKVWLPELYFTIGFRFNSNPFAKKTTEDKSTKPAEPNK